MPSPRVALWAMPDWSADGLDVTEYLIPSSEVRLPLHHCGDGEVVPFAHLVLNSVRLPAASVHEYTSGAPIRRFRRRTQPRFVSLILSSTG